MYNSKARDREQMNAKIVKCICLDYEIDVVKSN